MTTPMHVYSEIAARYGAKTEEEVDHFFQCAVFVLSPETQEAMLNELLDAHAEPPRPAPARESKGVRPRRTPPPSVRQEDRDEFLW